MSAVPERPSWQPKKKSKFLDPVWRHFSLCISRGPGTGTVFQSSQSSRPCIERVAPGIKPLPAATAAGRGVGTRHELTLPAGDTHIGLDARNCSFGRTRRLKWGAFAVKIGQDVVLHWSNCRKMSAFSSDILSCYRLFSYTSWDRSAFLTSLVLARGSGLTPSGWGTAKTGWRRKLCISGASICYSTGGSLEARQ